MADLMSFYQFIVDKLPPPVVENKETEIYGCDVNLTWSPPLDAGCPLTMYKIHYRDIQPGGNNTEWLQIPVTQLNKTFYVMPLMCDTEYEIAMSAKDEERESGLSSSWRVKTKSAPAGLYFNIFGLVFSIYFSYDS